MPHFYCKSIDQQFTGTRAELDTRRMEFRDGRLSGFFEIQSMPGELEVLIFAGGEEVASYRIWRNAHLKISPAEIGIGWDRQAVPIRSVPLPDLASRCLWQALEFQLESQAEVHGMVEWQRFLETCRITTFTGSMEIHSEKIDGFIFLHEGLPSAIDAVFCTDEGFSSNLETVDNCLDGTLSTSLYKADPVTQAYQCARLRQGSAGWGNLILSNYKDMVGGKLLALSNSDLNALLLHQQANIHLADIDIIDNHFFFDSRAAADIYRILFRDLAQLIGRVIGGMVTRRIMTNSFNRLGPGEQETLKAHVLTPAALVR